MISNKYGVVSHSLSSYDKDAITLQRVADFLGPRDMVHCERVCTLWRAFCKNQEIWLGLSLREGIPLVAGENRDRKADFQTLYPITISGARINRTIGKVEGKIPFISEVFMSVLNAPDPFEEGKLMKDTWVFVVDPVQVKRTAGVQTPLDFDSKGNLVEVPNHQLQSGKELVIPFSLKNLKILCSYPLEGRENMPVFTQHCYNEVFNQCGASSDKVSVYFMRRWIAEESRGLTYAEQEELVGGFDITPLRIRALFDAIVILESGTCPDARKPQWSYARCPDVVHNSNINYHASIGGFAPCSGAHVDGALSRGYDESGVAPGVPAEVLWQLGLGFFFGTSAS